MDRICLDCHAYMAAQYVVKDTLMINMWSHKLVILKGLTVSAEYMLVTAKTWEIILLRRLSTQEDRFHNIHCKMQMKSIFYN